LITIAAASANRHPRESGDPVNTGVSIFGRGRKSVGIDQREEYLAAGEYRVPAFTAMTDWGVTFTPPPLRVGG
jgi:hypothetical protein